MKIEEITLRNFRNYQELTFRPHDGINLFFGQNGSGKTNLLEAIHCCALGKSHRVANDQNIIKTGERSAFCEISVRTQLTRQNISLRLQPDEQQKKLIQIDGKRIRKFSELMGCLQCVIFSPEDLDLVKEGPAIRRRFLDMMISQFSRSYFISLQQYRLAMEQRNALLKEIKMNRPVDNRMLDVYEQAMAASAETIVAERKKVIRLLAEESLLTYRTISGREEEFSVHYQSVLRETDSPMEEMIHTLKENREDDVRYGMTSCGPHRDDLVMTLNRKNMKMFASQGQMRTAALSLKLAQMKVFKSISGEYPVLLLDDVMSELDISRRMHLLEEIGNTQTFITCTDESDLEDCKDKRVYAVSVDNGNANLRMMHTGTEAEIIFKEPDFT